LFLKKQESHLSSIIDYFSAPNLIDTFNLRGDFNYEDSIFKFLQKNSVLSNNQTLLDIKY
jgi:hypothetical protein